jgi:outer membrane protein assembly factor BamA
MRLIPWGLFLGLSFSATVLPADCVHDNRTKKNAGILITDFTITGTQTIGANELARVTSDLIGSCFDEDSEEMEERVRASFQERGYFAVVVNSFKIKPRDPLGVPKPVTAEADVSDGPRYKLGEITFLENHAFPSETLRDQFPLKRGAIFERGKVVGGLESLRKLYSTKGFLDVVMVPNTNFASEATVALEITMEEGPQYHMGKLEIVASKEAAARLSAEWKLPEGDPYDKTYIDQYLETNRDLLPHGFSRANVDTIQNCPDAAVEVRMIVDPAEDKLHFPPKSVPCEEKPAAAK